MRHVLFAFLSLCLCISSLAQENVLVVEVVGVGSGGKESTIAQVERQAQQDAMRKALDRAGVYLKSVTQVDLAVVTKDEIQAWAEGFVRVLEVQEPKTVFDPELKAFRCEIRLKAEVRTRDMADLLGRVKQEQAEQAGATQPLEFEYIFLAQRLMGNGVWTEVRVKDGSALRTGDKLQIWFKPDRDCYAYVINQDGSGAVYVMFPHRDAISNRMEGGREYMLPDRDLAYELDAVVGLETFYLAVSSTPMADLEWIISRMKTGNGAPREEMVAMLEGTLRTRGVRGVGRVVPGRKASVQLSSGRVTEQVTELLQGKGALVQVITLDHQ